MSDNTKNPSNEALSNYCPHHDLRHTRGGGILLGPTGKGTDPIASIIHTYLSREPSTVAICTSTDVISSLDVYIDSDSDNNGHGGVTLTSFEGGGYVHVDLEHTKEVLEIVEIATTIAKESLYRMQEGWTPEEELQEIKEEIASLEKLYNTVKEL